MNSKPASLIAGPAFFIAIYFAFTFKHISKQKNHEQISGL